MSDLPIGLRISAALRSLDQNFTPYYILQKGNEFSGTILLSLIQPDGTIILNAQQRNEQYKLTFMPVHKEVSLAPDKAHEYIQRAMKRDPDLWVIEIETRENQTYFDEF